MGAPASHRDIHFTSADGLALYGRDYPAQSDATPLLCLSGLTRNVRDFEPLAQWLGGQRRLITMDYRGRGRSAYAPDPSTYRPDVELADALRLLDELAVDQVSVVGTSRGGIIAMIMAAQYPQRLKGVLLNDVGPVIEKASLLRIRSYLGKALSFATWDEAADALKKNHPGFETLSATEWLAYARRVYIEKGGRITNDYDLRLAEAFPTDEQIQQAESPDLWPLFDTLLTLPVTVLRAEHSDLLSDATVAQMKRRHPLLAAHTIKDRGHVPFLDEPDAQAAIKAWLKVV
ncbi:alpha/beta fold hydrolase [Aestuariivirga sp. YIM B02566]|uniref:Alpha/beta hydrolase n=1 Tax=Taklimakanibacter albus TaxID=2800327 RepID=A0ACC5R1F1_9HYPH|nr:alpha/beta hydrolase [Aestuariivirga sp. YIM B02566]